MGNFGFNGALASHMQGALCFICKENVENVSRFLQDCTEFRQNFDSIWLSLKQKVISANPIDGSQNFDFVSHLDRQQKTLLLSGGCPSHLIKLQSLWSTGSYVQLSVKFIVLEKTGCVSCRHHGLKSKAIFLCFKVSAYFSALSISYCILWMVLMQSFKFCILNIISCSLDFYYFWIL